jgi:predicted nuclease of restriction endonuclease-like RecB superfamily
MLTGELVRPRLHKHGGLLRVQLIDVDNPNWQKTAEELIALFRSYLGQSMQQWYTALENYEGERLDYIVIRGLAKVLADAATFTPIETAMPPNTLREKLFAQGPAFASGDLFNTRTREGVLGEFGRELALSQEQIEAALFADRPIEYCLTETGPDWTPAELLARYNLELSRGALYWATHLQIEIHDTYKDFWKYLKLFKLMFEAHPLEEGGYHVMLDGPISPFVKSATRYGRQFAAFLPALLLCERWTMAAEVRLARSEEPVTYKLDPKSPISSHFKRSGTFDSQLEADFAAEFEAKFGGKRGQWELSREEEVLLLGDTVMIPDFALTHKRDGRRALVEIVGFWHPDYLRRKVEKVRAANCSNLILLVYEGVNLAADKLAETPSEVLYFPNKPVLKDVMEAVERQAI